MQSGTWLADARKAYDSNDMVRAESLYRMVLAVDGKQVEALRMVGLLLAQRGNFTEGLDYLDKSIASNPKIGRLYFFRGNILEHMQRFDDALRAYEKTIALEPSFPPVYTSKGIALAAQGRLTEALEAFRIGVELGPDRAEAHFNLGNTYQNMQRYAEAVPHFERTIAMAPGYVPAFNNLGVCFKNLNRFDEAFTHYRRALEIDPNYYHAHNNIGVAQHALGYLEEALASYDAALQQYSGYAEVYNNKAITLSMMGRFEEAIANYDRAIELSPAYFEAYNNKGYTLQEMKDYTSSIEWYDKATELSPAYADACWNKSLLLMLTGDFERGLPLFEWRWKSSQAPKSRDFKTPLWLGEEPLVGKTILLHAEQGFGDAIQFCRYADRVSALGAKVLLEVPSSLAELMGTLQSRPTIITDEQTIPPHDYQCPLMSLPLAFKTLVETIPAHVPYLFAAHAKQEEWRAKLGGAKKLRVGISWSGNAQHKNNYNRSIQLAQFAKLFTLKETVEFHVLQKDISTEEYSILRMHDIATYVTELKDFSDTAALVAEMDLVISVDTAIAHLAGALAKPVWIFIPFAPDFRWMSERTDSVWYPTARLFRQSTSGNWPSVIETVTDELARYKAPALHG